MRYSPNGRIAGRDAGAWGIHMEAPRRRDQGQDFFLMVAAPIFEAMDRAQIALLSVRGGMSPFQTDRGALG